MVLKGPRNRVPHRISSRRRSLIHYGRQSISREDIEAVTQVLSSDFLTQGPVVQAFEKALSDFCGGAHACAVANGTDGLYLIYRALSLGAGDRLWVSPITFVATANAGRLCGAEIDLVDIDLTTANMDVALLRKKLERARTEKKLPKIVAVTHLGGQPCEMAEIKKLSEEFRFRVVEDACHALGSQYRGSPVGSCEFSDAAVFSFHPVKSITTGEGGAVMTRNAEIADRIQLLKTHGITRDPGKMRESDVGPWYYEQIELGGNFRVSDIHCALGLSQLKRLNSFVTQREAQIQRYLQKFKNSRADSSIRLLQDLPDRTSARHLCVAQIDFKAIGLNKKKYFETLKNNGVALNVHYIPVHFQPYYADLGFKRGMFPNAETYYERAVTLPLYVGLSVQDQDHVVEALERCLTHEARRD